MQIDSPGSGEKGKAMTDYMRNAKYKIATHNRWGYSTGTVYGNSKRKLTAYVQEHYMPWLTKRAITSYIQFNEYQSDAVKPAVMQPFPVRR